MSMGYVYGFIVIMSIVVFFMSPPEFVASRLTSLIQTHPTLDENNAARISVNGSILDAHQTEQFIQAFNGANFLLSHGSFHPRLDNKDVIRVDVQGLKREFTFAMYSEGRHIEIVRYRRNRRPPVAYRIESVDLKRALDEFAV